MGILSDIFEFLDDFTRDDYLETSKIWFDNVWKTIKRPYKGEGILVIKNGKLYRRFNIFFDDKFSYTIYDTDEEGCDLRYVKFSQRQKNDILSNGSLSIKKYFYD